MSDLFRTAIKCTIIAAFCIHTVIKARTNTHTHTSYNSSFHSLLGFFFFFFCSKAADERSRWFVPWMVSAPLSPLSDHLHLLPSNATRLWSCVHTGLQHMPETGSVQNMSHSKVPIKTKLKVMKQLFNVVEVPWRPSWAEWTDFWKHAAMYPNDAQVQLSFPQGTC